MLGSRFVRTVALTVAVPAVATAVAGASFLSTPTHAAGDIATRRVIRSATPPTSSPKPVPTTKPTPVAVRPFVGSERPKLNKPDMRPVPRPAVAIPVGGKYSGPDIEAYPSYVGQSTCDPTDKPGTVALRNTLLAHYPATVSFGISRACSIGGKSEHHEGRAFDWGANVNNPVQNAAVSDFFKTIFATDKYGHTDAIARRMGIMYLIWNKKIRMMRPGSSWEPYSGDSPHTDHVHISMSWAGARAQTSFWSGHVPSELLQVVETPRPHGSHEPWPSWTPHPTPTDTGDHHHHWPPDVTPTPTATPTPSATPSDEPTATPSTTP